MSEILISPKELREAAEQFRLAGTESQGVIHRLDEVTSRLEGRWSGATQELFTSHYQSWRQQMDTFTALLSNLAQQMRTIADRMEHNDR